MELEQTLERDAEIALSKDRFSHVQGVVETAEQLASLHGVDRVSARLAAWLHDLAREWPEAKLEMEAEKIDVPKGFGAIPTLLHGPVAAHLGRTVYDIGDADILHAVTYHTTGSLGMGMLDKVLFLADTIEPGRRFPEVTAIRELSQVSLDDAMLLALDSSLKYLLAVKKPIFPLTVMVRNEYLEKVQKA